MAAPIYTPTNSLQGFYYLDFNCDLATNWLCCLDFVFHLFEPWLLSMLRVGAGERKAREKQRVVKRSPRIWLRRVEKSPEESDVKIEMVTRGSGQTAGNKISQ